jgi:hypothetical protein
VDPTSTVKKARLYRFGEGAQQLNDNRRAFGGPYFPAAESASIGLARGRSANRRRAKHRARLAPRFATINAVTAVRYDRSGRSRRARTPTP